MLSLGNHLGGFKTATFGSSSTKPKQISYIAEGRNINLFADVDAAAKREHFKAPLDIFNILFSTQNEKEALETLLTKSENTSYISNCILYGIRINPKQTIRLLNMLALFTTTNGFKNSATDYVKDILIHQGIIRGPVPEKSFNEIINIFPEGSLEQAIKDDDVEKFNHFINEATFNPRNRVTIKNYSPLFFVEGETQKKPVALTLGTGLNQKEKCKELSYMQIISFFGSIKCFKLALSLGTFSIDGVQKYAVAGGNKEIIHLLEQNGVNFDNCFDISVKYHRYDISDWLLQNYECQAVTLSESIEYFNIPAFFFILKNSIDKTQDPTGKALLSAAKTGNIEVLKYLVEELKVNVESKDNLNCTPLYNAAKNGHLSIVRYLAKEYNADTEIMTNSGWNPLFIAAKNNYLDIVRYLVKECNANVEVKTNNGSTPLYIASKYDSLEVVKFLTQESKANVETKTNNGWTPIYAASSSGHLEVVRYLAEKCNADYDAKTNGGTSPLSIAMQKNHPEVVRYLAEECNASAEENIKVPNSNKIEMFLGKK